ncbi:fumarylacetoacetate hydrolase family protein [Chryseosolibacter indicus]|uniref:Fumarylacetoacetate hydrolase family protein n=1 Tax=Chryseosolibacter indicus TaxID=2782351 RepID=A0ABS5VRQ0_9BACT|nr:fumarylacetoacetate hydrolase family protein [Chryseosolibacter indicus]MBT1703505.1 fumarylacetoacetate hydrolase family protein [Chryseosolibacter indicus]
MRLLRFGDPGKEKPGILENDQILDVSSYGKDFGEQFFDDDGLNKFRQWVEQNKSNLKVVDKNTRFGAPFTRPSKIICVGLNYTKHALESKMPLPTEPIIFFKSTTALTGPNDDLIIPRGSVKTDWEVELAFVIGKKASYVEENDALSYIAGFCLHNDYSERAFQLERNGQWVKGKSADTFAPMGPYLVTIDELPDYDKLHMWSKVNGKMMQDNNTDDMIFGVPKLLSYISQFMTLLPGDVISTGTPAGVGMGFNPPIYLKPGDVVELGIEKLGTQRQVAKGYQE